MGKRKATRKRSKVTDIDVTAWISVGKLIDGLVGLDNVVKLDIQACGDEFKHSIKNPLAPGGIVDDCIDAGKVAATLKGINAVVKGISGRNVGGRILNLRIHL